MSNHVLVLKPAVFRAIDAYNKALALIKQLGAEILALTASNAALEGRVALLLEAAEADQLIIEELTAALNQVFPQEPGGSTGNM